MGFIAVENLAHNEKLSLQGALNLESGWTNEERLGMFLSQMPSAARARFATEWRLQRIIRKLKSCHRKNGTVFFRSSFYSLIADALARRQNASELPYTLHRLLELNAAGTAIPPLIYLCSEAAAEEGHAAYSVDPENTMRRKGRARVEQAYRRIASVLRPDGFSLELMPGDADNAKRCMEWEAAAPDVPSSCLRELISVLGYDWRKFSSPYPFESNIHIAAAALAREINEYYDNEGVVQEEVRSFSRGTKPYLIRQVGSLCVRITKGGCGRTSFSIGTFPILKVQDTYSPISDVTLDITTERQDIRRQQTFSLGTRYGGINLCESRESLRSLVAEDFCNARQLIYADPYHYIGDSIIGLFFPDNFKACFPNISKVTVFSRSCRHLRLFYQARQYNLAALSAFIKREKYCVLADLFEHSFDSLARLLESLKGCEFYLVILGRNLYVRGQAGKVTLIRSSDSDPILQDRNIEDYMQEVIAPFLEPKAFEPVLSTSPVKHFWLNPFGSRIEKTVPLPLVIGITRELARRHRGPLNIIGGLRDNPNHHEWIAGFISCARELGLGEAHYRIAYFDDLTALGQAFQLNPYSFVFTADTSITHLANRCGIPNVTIYRPSLWDSESTLSMALDSPIGFSRYCIGNLPLVLTENTPEYYDAMANHAVSAAAFFCEDMAARNRSLNEMLTCIHTDRLARTNQMQWHKALYSSAWLTRSLPRDKSSQYLRRAAVRISPINKLATYFRSLQTMPLRELSSLRRS